MPSFGEVAEAFTFIVSFFDFFMQFLELQERFEKMLRIKRIQAFLHFHLQKVSLIDYIKVFLKIMVNQDT